jgi:hypothetical protein
MGLAGKNLAKEINGSCRNALLDEVCSADVNQTFDSDGWWQKDLFRKKFFKIAFRHFSRIR